MACRLVPSHYLTQFWIIVNWTLRNKLQWNFNRNSNIFNKKNALENVVCEMASILSRPQCVNSLRLRNAYMCHQTRPSLVQIMSCRLFGDKPLPKPVLGYCQLDYCEYISVKFWLKYNNFHSGKVIWNCRLQNWGPFCFGLSVFIKLMEVSPWIDQEPISIQRCSLSIRWPSDQQCYTL